MILIAAILKIALWQFLLNRLIVNGLIMTRDMCLNKMIPLNGCPGDILKHKSQLQKCIDVKYVIFRYFFRRYLGLHDKYYNLAIENSFNRFLDPLNVGLEAKNRLSKLIKTLDILN